LGWRGEELGRSGEAVLSGWLGGVWLRFILPTQRQGKEDALGKQNTRGPKRLDCSWKRKSAGPNFPWCDEENNPVRVSTY